MRLVQISQPLTERLCRGLDLDHDIDELRARIRAICGFVSVRGDVLQDSHANGPPTMVRKYTSLHVV